MKLHIVDVFAERKYAGNQLAVVLDAAGLTTERMQDIAAEMNFSETTFVIEANPTRARVRIFTPGSELPFAGHPTVGTAWVLAGAGRPPEEGASYTLDLHVGPVAVRFNGGIGWMTPPEVTFTGTLEPVHAAALISVTESDLAPGFPIRLAEVGPRFVLIGLKSLVALKSARLNPDLHADLLARGIGVQCVFVFTQEPYGPDADFASRMFFDARGVREDPATGSANSAFAAYLRDLHGVGHEYVVDQGVEIGRPSRLYLKVADKIEVGGKTQAVLTGELV